MVTLTGRMGLEPIQPINHWHNVKTLTVRISVSVRVNKALQFIHLEGGGGGGGNILGSYY